MRILRHGVMGPSTKRIFLSTLFAFLFFITATNFFCPKKIRGKRGQLLAEEVCMEWEPALKILNNSDNQKTKIKLDQERLLLPLLYNGPNNQIWGLRQAAYVAILLNRTLVLPLFHKHLTDDSGPESIIDANHRFQVDHLSTLMSVTTMEKYHHLCGDSVDVVFHATTARSWTVESLKRAEAELNLKFLHTSSNGIIRKSEPFLSGIKIKSPLTAHAENRRIIRTAYESDQRCAVYDFPFREIKMEINKGYKQDEYYKYRELLSSESIDEIPTWALLNVLYKSMLAPTYIQEISENFIEHVFGDLNYFALHWRYDKEDFYKFMCDKEEGTGNQNQAEMCKIVYKITPKTLAKAIIKYANYVNKISGRNLQKIYIATPRTQSTLDFLSLLVDELSSNKMEVITQLNFDDFIADSNLFSTCPFLESNYNDFSALVEMEICSHSSVFLRSGYSSWSDSVIINRDLMRIEQDLRRFDLHVLNIPGLSN